MRSSLPHNPRISGNFYSACLKHRPHSIGTERLKLPRDSEKFRSQFVHIDLSIYTNLRLEHFIGYHLVRDIVNGIPEIWNPINCYRHTCCKFMSAKSYNLILTPSDGRMNVKSTNGARTSLCNTVDCCKQYNRQMVFLRKPRRDNTDNSRVPASIVQNDNSIARPIQHSIYIIAGFEIGFFINAAAI